MLPIGINYLNGRVNRKPPGWIELLAGGELLLIAAAVAADGMGKAFLGGDKFRFLRIACGVSCAALLIATSVYFGRVAFALEEQRSAVVEAIQANESVLAMRRMSAPAVDRTTTASDSSWLFLFTVACALGVILVEED